MSAIDPVTGNKFEREFAMYINYHGLTHEEATLIMQQTSHASRDRVFGNIVQKRWDQTHASEKVKDVDGYIRLINAICSQIDEDNCQCDRCQLWKKLQSKWCK